MKAIILAAGRGSRLQAYTDDKPKCLNKVGEKTIIEWQISVLNSCGVDNVTLVVGYRSEMLKKYGNESILNPKWEKTNMVRSLLCANKAFDQPLIITYSDILYNKKAVLQLMEESKDAVVAYDLNWKSLWQARYANPLDDIESFRIGNDRRINAIGQKVTSIEEVEGQYIGLMRFSPLALRWIEEFTRSLDKDKLDKMDMTSLLQHLIWLGYPVYGTPIRGGWCEIDRISDLLLASKLHKEGLLNFSI